MCRTLILAVIAQFLFGWLPVEAELKMNNSECSKELSWLSFGFNEIKKGPQNAKGLFDEKISRIQDLASKSGITTLEIVNKEYSLTPQITNPAFDPKNPEYQFIATITLSVEPADKVSEFMNALIAEGLQPSLKSNIVPINC